ncbi:MAG: DUF523 domain-containing protein [Acidobacteria bacterium]|nr:MAG: DUF523 domain-containing protein [Acidobacteriota bacterium]
MTKPPEPTEKVLVSACLLGYRCRYNAEILEPRKIPEPVDAIVPICPEELGGLPTPRTPSFFEDMQTGREVLHGNGRVVSEAGEDRTAAFVNGAKKTLKIAKEAGAKRAYLKERSPSCGCHTVYVGEDRVPGIGVTAALLEENGIVIISVE